MKTNETLRTMALIPAAMAMLILQAAMAGQAGAQAATADASSFLYIQPYAPPAESAPAAAQERQAAHEQAALLARDQAKALLEQGQFAQADDLARQAITEYSDTYVAAEFTEILALAEQGLAAANPAGDAGEASPRHAEFMALRNRGVERYNSGDFQGAIPLLQAALAQESNAEVAALLEECIDRTELPRLAVADFAVSGDAEIPDAGRTVAELMLSHFDPQRFQRIDRCVLAEGLARQGLTPGQVAENPALLRDRLIPGVRLMVAGSVVRRDNLVIAARMIDLRTGEIVQTAEVTLIHPAQLQPALDELAAVLQMNDEQKQAYLENQRRQWEQQRLVAQAMPDLIAQDVPTLWIRQPVVVRFLAGWDRDHRKICDDEARRFHDRRHHEEALLILVRIQFLQLQGRHDQAATIARDGFKRYGDTPFARRFTALEAAPAKLTLRTARPTTMAPNELNRSRPGSFFATNVPVEIKRPDDRATAGNHFALRPPVPAPVAHPVATPALPLAPRTAPPAANTWTTRRDTSRDANTTPMAPPAPPTVVNRRNVTAPAAAETPTTPTRRSLNAPPANNPPPEAPRPVARSVDRTPPVEAPRPVARHIDTPSPTAPRAAPVAPAPAPVATPRTLAATPLAPSTATRADTASRSFARPVDRTPVAEPPRPVARSVERTPAVETPRPVARHADTPAPTRQVSNDTPARQAPASIRPFAADPPARPVAQAAPAPSNPPPARTATTGDNTRKGNDRNASEDPSRPGRAGK